MSSSVRPTPVPPPRPGSDPAARPRPLAQRLGLLMILLVLPVAAVTLPTLVTTHFFGQRPRPKTAASPTPADTSGLRQELDRQASGLLPTPAPLTPEPVRVSVHDPGHVAPRAAKVVAQAHALGGSAVEGLADAGTQHLFVDLPAGAADIFRRAVAANTPAESLPTPPPAREDGARDQVEVFIRVTSDDE